jgi:hypothetical protein
MTGTSPRSPRSGCAAASPSPTTTSAAWPAPATRSPSPVGARLPALVGRPWRQRRELPQQAVAVHRHDRAWPWRSSRRLRRHPVSSCHQGVRPGLRGLARPAEIRNPDRINLTAYRAGAAGEDCVTVINKTHGAGAADAAVTIVPVGADAARAEVMALVGDPPCAAGRLQPPSAARRSRPPGPSRGGGAPCPPGGRCASRSRLRPRRSSGSASGPPGPMSVRSAASGVNLPGDRPSPRPCPGWPGRRRARCPGRLRGRGPRATAPGAGASQPPGAARGQRS